MNIPGVGEVQIALQKGLEFLASQQNHDGSFGDLRGDSANSANLRSSSKAQSNDQAAQPDTFASAIILSALSCINLPASVKIRNRLAAWLSTQRMPDWSFANPAAIDRAEQKPDLNLTFCALAALHLHNPSLVTQEGLAGAVKLLLSAEAQVGGPYFQSPEFSQDNQTAAQIDLATNCNIAYFLKMTARPLPNLNKLMERAIVEREFDRLDFSDIYFLARAYSGVQQKTLALQIAKLRKNSWWGSPLRSALAMTSLAQAQATNSTKTAANRLLKLQNANGSWPAEAFLAKATPDKAKLHHNSACLTTALLLEALALHSKAAQPNSERTNPAIQPKPNQNKATEAELLHRRIATAARDELRHLDPSLRSQSQKILQRIYKADKEREITLLPHLFNRSLKHPLRQNAPELLTRLGLANMYVWAAYTAYDDLMDGESDASLLPAANMALRRTLRHLWLALPENRHFQQLVTEVFDIMDSANSQEITYYRLKITDGQIHLGNMPKRPDRMGLAGRSLAHALTPIAILAAAGINASGSRAVQIRRSIEHYLAARQMNDDLHDWEQDIRTGIASSAAVSILRELDLQPGKYELTSLIKAMRHQFWQHTLTAACDQIRRHAVLARRAATASQLLKQENIITDLASKIERSAERTLSKHRQARQFLNSYAE